MFDKILIVSVPGSFLCGLVITVVMVLMGHTGDAHTMVGHATIATGIIAGSVHSYRKMNALSVEIKNGNGHKQ